MLNTTKCFYVAALRHIYPLHANKTHYKHLRLRVAKMVSGIRINLLSRLLLRMWLPTLLSHLK